MELTKALQACEIIKTRIPFLHQENKLLTYKVPLPEKEGAEEGDRKRERVRTGLSITLSRNQFDISDYAGYQKPKPRQFM